MQWNRFEINHKRTCYSFQKRVFLNDLRTPSYDQISLTFHFAYYIVTHAVTESVNTQQGNISYDDNVLYLIPRSRFL